MPSRGGCCLEPHPVRAGLPWPVAIGDPGGRLKTIPFINTLSKQVPLILVCRGSGPLVGDTPSVTMDNRLGARLVLDYLAELGHRHIVLSAAAWVGDLHERGEAYVEFMNERFGGVPAGYQQLVENALEEGYQAMIRSGAAPAAYCALCSGR